MKKSTGDDLGGELRNAARLIQEFASRLRCYSVITDIVGNACDHISARARLAEFNQETGP